MCDFLFIYLYYFRYRSGGDNIVCESTSIVAFELSDKLRRVQGKTQIGGSDHTSGKGGEEDKTRGQMRSRTKRKTKPRNTARRKYGV